MVKREEPRSYEVRLDDGSEIRRNRKALHRLPPPATSVKLRNFATSEPLPSPMSSPVSTYTPGKRSAPSSPAPSPSSPRFSTSAPHSPSSSPTYDTRENYQADRPRSRSIDQPSPRGQRYDLRARSRVNYRA